MDITKKKIALSLLIAVFLAAFEGTVISTAAPLIVKDLHGFEFVSWIFSLYLLTAAISTPIYGKLADLYGRKKILSLGILIFLIGSLLAGLSQNMYHLIISRAVQGLGAGSILTVTFTILGDVFTLKERAVIQGAISTIWGVASLIGPLIGGFLIDYLSWHWIFFINIPFGIICLFFLQKHLRDTTPVKSHKIDYLGTIALSATIGTFLYGIMIGYANGTLLLSLSGMAIFMTAFYFIEKQSAEPIVPFLLITKSSTVINGISFFASVLLIAATVYFPLYIQTILEYSAITAGLTLASMSISWFTSSLLLGRLMEAYTFRQIIITASLILLAACGLTSTLTIDSSLATIALYAFIFGFGFSGTLNTLIFMVQDSVGYENRGAAIGLNSLVKMLAQTIGVSVCGTLINMKLSEYFEMKNIAIVDAANLYNAQNALSAAQIHDALFYALHFVFLVLIAISLLTVLTSCFLPKELPINSKRTVAVR